MTADPQASPHRRVRVLIVDDSALMRKVLSELLVSDPEIEVVGTASDPLVAREKIKALNPDVITLDVEMPNLDGIAFLERLMRLRPMPVVMISALIPRSAEITLQALEMGAVDFIPKPVFDIAEGFNGMRDMVRAKVKAAAGAVIHSRAAATQPPRVTSSFRGSNRIVAIGASTGGVAALGEILMALPADGPPILIAQHMPPGFTRQFAKRLDGLCAMSISEAADEARIMPGHVFVAPGDRHLSVRRSGGFYHCHLSDDAAVNGHQPSVDVLFKSMADTAGANGVGLLLTGMGQDGAIGLKRMRASGATTACQDEATSLIYGMPKAAMTIGAAQHQIALEDMAGFIVAESSTVPAAKASRSS